MEIRQNFPIIEPPGTAGWLSMRTFENFFGYTKDEVKTMQFWMKLQALKKKREYLQIAKSRITEKLSRTDERIARLEKNLAGQMEMFDAKSRERNP